MHVFGMLFCGLTSLACTRSALAQDAIASRKVAQAERIMGALTIDGSLQDSAWQRVPISRDFEELSPQPGTSPQFDTEVRFAYDDAALYIGARMWDDAPDSVLHQLSERDRMANTDEFGIWFSTFDDGLNAVRFSTTPDGIQVDEQLSPNNNDQSWDAVWDVACQIDSAGWTAEFRIPWMAFRFPKQAEQAWGMNMYRTLRRQREESVWNPMDPTQKLLNQGGVLRGISKIDPPLRLSLFPYLSTYGIATEGEISSTYNGGMDMKVGLGNAFTLDMTLIPDFRASGHRCAGTESLTVRTAFRGKSAVFQRGYRIVQQNGYVLFAANGRRRALVECDKNIRPDQQRHRTGAASVGRNKRSRHEFGFLHGGRGRSKPAKQRVRDHFEHHGFARR